MALSLRERFDGNFGALPRHTFPFQGACVPPSFFTCTGGQQLFVAVVPEGTEGGVRWRGHIRNETLCVLLLGEPNMFSAGRWLREASVPARFFWFTAAQGFRRARLHERGATMQSLCLTSYSLTSTDQQRLTVHSLLGWTFQCHWNVFQFRWHTDFDVDHFPDRDHGNNALANLQPRRANTVEGESEGHRAESGRLGGHARQEALREQRDAVRRRRE